VHLAGPVSNHPEMGQTLLPTRFYNIQKYILRYLVIKGSCSVYLYRHIENGVNREKAKTQKSCRSRWPHVDTSSWNIVGRL